MIKTVNGQFISRVEDSGQVYLDVDKDVDHAALIDKRIESLDNGKLDQAYYNALARILERTDSYYPGTHLAWEYDDGIEWRERHAARSGYLFFGTPMSALLPSPSAISTFTSSSRMTPLFTRMRRRWMKFSGSWCIRMRSSTWR